MFLLSSVDMAVLSIFEMFLLSSVDMTVLSIFEMFLLSSVDMTVSSIFEMHQSIKSKLKIKLELFTTFHAGAATRFMKVKLRELLENVLRNIQQKLPTISLQ